MAKLSHYYLSISRKKGSKQQKEIIDELAILLSVLARLRRKVIGFTLTRNCYKLEERVSFLIRLNFSLLAKLQMPAK